MGINGRIVDEISVEVRNKVNEKSFKNIKAQDKIMVLPHCLRHANCEAKLGSSGIVCKNCNRCVIGVLKSKAEGLGYKVFIIPGSTFLKKIVEKNKFKGFWGCMLPGSEHVHDETFEVFLPGRSTPAGRMC